MARQGEQHVNEEVAVHAGVRFGHAIHPIDLGSATYLLGDTVIAYGPPPFPKEFVDLIIEIAYGDNEVGTYSAEVQVLDASNALIRRDERLIAFPAPPPDFQMESRLQWNLALEVTFPAEGSYQVRVLLDEKLIGDGTLFVKRAG